MSSSRAKKLVIVGLDAFTPTIVERLVAEGGLHELSQTRGHVNRSLSGYEPEVLTEVPIQPASGWENLPVANHIREVVLPPFARL